MLTNDGDYSLLKSILKSILECIPNARFTLPLWKYSDIDTLKKWKVKTCKAQKPMMPYGIMDIILKLIYAILYRLFKFLPPDEELRAIAESDLAIVPTRDMLVLGSLGRATQFFYTLYRIYLPKLMRKPTMLYASDVRPGNGLARALLTPWMRLVFNSLDMISVRDANSLCNLIEIGISPSKVRLVGDPAFLLKPASREEAIRILKREGVPIHKRPLIGFSLNPLIYRPRKISRGSQRKIIIILIDLVNFLIKELGATVIFIPRVTIFEESDMTYAEVIKRFIKQKDRFIILSKQYQPEQVRAIIGLLDLFIAMAFHASVHAVCVGVPLVAVDYGKKTLEVMCKLDLEKLVIPAKDLTSDELKNKIKLAWLEREQVKAKLLSRVKEYIALAKRNAEAFKAFLESCYPKPYAKVT